MSVRFGLLIALIVGVLALVAVASLMISNSETQRGKCQGGGKEPTIDRAVLHWVSWDITTRYSYSPDDVRRAADKVRRLNVSRELSCLSADLAKLEMTSVRSAAYRMNGRLIIEVTSESGERLTYFADQFRICILEKEVCAPNSETFRSDISALMLAEDR